LRGICSSPDTSVYAGPIPEVTLSTSDNAAAYINNFFHGIENAPPAFVVNPFLQQGQPILNDGPLRIMLGSLLAYTVK
jgi:hypothetical protein